MRKKLCKNLIVPEEIEMINKIRWSVVCLVMHEDRILIGKMKKDSPKKLAGKQHLPGGDVKEEDYLVVENSPFENLFFNMIEQAVKRIIEQTVGLSVKLDDLPQVNNRTKIQEGEIVCIFWCPCKLTEGSSDELIIGPESDLEEAEWINLKRDVVLNRIDRQAFSKMPQSVISFLMSKSI